MNQDFKKCCAGVNKLGKAQGAPDEIGKRGL